MYRINQNQTNMYPVIFTAITFAENSCSYWKITTEDFLLWRLFEVFFSCIRTSHNFDHMQFVNSSQNPHMSSFEIFQGLDICQKRNAQYYYVWTNFRKLLKNGKSKPGLHIVKSENTCRSVYTILKQSLYVRFCNL